MFNGTGLGICRISTRLSIEHANILEVSKDDIVSSLSAYRKGNIEDKAYQAELFDLFLTRIYLYDDHLKICFSFAKDKDFIDIPLTPEQIDDIENIAVGCSYKLSLEPPQQEAARFKALRLPFCRAKTPGFAGSSKKL